MKAPLLIGVVLIVIGIVTLLYGEFTYARESAAATIGPLEISVKDREIVSVPTWIGVASIVIGGGMLLVPFTGHTGRVPTVKS